MKKIPVLLSVSVIAFFSCNDPKGKVENDSLAEATQDTAVMYNDQNGKLAADGLEIINVDEGYWDNLDWDAPTVDNSELQNEEIESRSTAGYTFYMMEDRLLFDTDKATLRPEGEQKLNKLMKAMNALPANSQLRIFGHADGRASNEYNKKLSEERATTIKTWLQDKGGINAGRISIEAFGETVPRATNQTPKGRQLNRRVAIVVVTKQPDAQ
jgi:outer membrane protein OmpA-like peptidoglycan-associated protein